MRILIFLLAALCFGLPALPASAVPIKKADVQSVCGKKLEDPGFGHTGCTKKCGNSFCDYDCNKKTGKCNAVVFRTTSPEPDEDGHPLFTPVTPEGELFPMAAVRQRELLAACKKLPGAVFAEGAGQFGCINPNCDKKGHSCEVTCEGDQCLGRMPQRPTRGFLLISILQNGDDVVHDHLPMELDSGASTTGDGAGTSKPPVIIY